MTSLAKIFTTQIRTKPGKTKEVMWDAQGNPIPGFAINYTYSVNFDETNIKAGDHYHRQKHELYSAMHGEFHVVIEDTKTKTREEHTLKAGDGQLIYVKPPLAHVVVSKTPGAVLLVMANAPDVDSDTFPYNVG
jgi:oxalate decarboxylase/phosphoglucose isomerase-like protein (cupin superfamily)